MAWLADLAPQGTGSAPPATTGAPARLRRIAMAELTAPEARARWDSLAGRAAEPNPFHESWYLAPALAALDQAGEAEVMVLEAGGEWLGLLPLARSPRYYGRPVPHLGNWLHGNAFLGVPLVAQGHEAPFWRALLAHVDGAAGAALFLHLAEIPLDGPLATALQRVCTEQQRPCGLVHREERALLASSLAPEAYLEAALSGKKRKELRRQYARLSEQGALAVTRRRDGTGLSQWTADFLALEAAGWKGGAGSALAASPATARLFAEALDGAATRGRLERLTLSLDGAPLAMLATFLAPPGAFSYKTAFDERFARFSPGVLLQRENLALLADPALDWCDSCAAADHPMIDHVWRERRAIGRFSVGIGGRLRRALFSPLLKAERARADRRASPAPVPDQVRDDAFPTGRRPSGDQP
ncbi:GNAT family N-acetyltransferase [Novosphingobium bradum]|uniref:GNAT family N-acetyltransferase n=1 Tax=Novosphingobium bradum TaxID=1737444 RepID=A0ABV7IRR7_9SPHN